MTGHWRILIASPKSGIAWVSHLQLEQSPQFTVVGIVDPRDKIAFDEGCASADVILFEADELLWLLDHRPTVVQTAFQNSPPMVLVEERNLLEIVHRGSRTWGILLHQNLITMSADRLALACDGYLVISMQILQHLRDDGLRLDIVKTLSEEELRVLNYLGSALPNEDVANQSGIREARVKALIRALTHKLRLRNRTALGVFAVENEGLPALSISKAP